MINLIDATFYENLQIVKDDVYDACGILLTNFERSAESEEYCACSFELDGKRIQYRVSKVTPKKSGQFVTVWKRNKSGITAPFDVSDDLDFIVVTSKKDRDVGQFIFPKSILVEKGIVSGKGKAGKRGIRVYPPWDNPENKQAVQTQRWQTRYFFNMSQDKTIHYESIKKLIQGL